MNVELLNYDEAARSSPEWNRLAGEIPFRRWEWLGTWWKHYGTGRDWMALAVRDDSGQIRGIAPWFVETVPAFGRRLEFLGTGHACSDYLSILGAAEDRDAIVQALANWLIESSTGRDAGWDMISFDGVSADCEVVTKLIAELELQDCITHRRESASTWQVPLPATWDGYLRALSKPNRRHVRTLQERLVDPGLVTIHLANTSDELERDWPLFVELHQRRQRSLGKAGCFASETFEHFVYEAAKAFRDQNELELLSIRRGDRLIAAQLALIGRTTKYAYQVGIDPDHLADSPGWLVHTQSIKLGIEQGLTAFDFLRGNEPHKQRMGARPNNMEVIRVIPPRLGPAVLHKAWMTGNTVKQWIKAGLEKSGLR